jgi:DNA repair exonuclease SbcCD ATPase subunit
MAKVHVEMTGKADQLMGELGRVHSLEERLERKLAEIGVASARVAAEQRKTFAEAAQLVREAESPLDGYNRKLAALQATLDAGKISQEAFGSAVEAAKQKMEAQQQTLDAATAAGQRAAQLDAERARVLQQLQNPFDRHNERMATYRQLLDTGRVGQEQFAKATDLSKQKMLEEEKAFFAASEAGKKAAQLDSERAKVLQQLQGPLDRHNERMATYRELLETGRIKQAEFDRAMEKSSATLKKEEKARGRGCRAISCAQGYPDTAGQV